MSLLILLLLIVGFVCFVLATFSVPVPRVNLVAAGLACWLLTVLIGAWPK